MSTIVNTGWLKDNNGEKFAPKTLSSQVVTSDGNILEGKISVMETKLNGIDTDVQSDWNENDSSSNSYIENRPFYESEVSDIWYSSEVTFESTYNVLEANRIETELLYPIAGETYRVIYDNVPYDVTCSSSPGLSNAETYYDLNDVGSDGLRISFLVVMTTSHSQEIDYISVECWVPEALVGTTHTLSIGTLPTLTVVKKLDAKFLPDEIANNLIYVGDGENSASALLNADSLGGYPASDYYTAEQVDEKLTDIDVSSQVQESLGGLKFVVLSQAQYDALTEKDPSTIYYIYEEV